MCLSALPSYRIPEIPPLCLLRPLNLPPVDCMSPSSDADVHNNLQDCHSPEHFLRSCFLMRVIRLTEAHKNPLQVWTFLHSEQGQTATRSSWSRTPWSQAWAQMQDASFRVRRLPLLHSPISLRKRIPCADGLLPSSLLRGHLVLAPPLGAAQVAWLSLLRRRLWRWAPAFFLGLRECVRCSLSQIPGSLQLQSSSATPPDPTTHTHTHIQSHDRLISILLKITFLFMLLAKIFTPVWMKLPSRGAEFYFLNYLSFYNLLIYSIVLTIKSKGSSLPLCGSVLFIDLGKTLSFLQYPHWLKERYGWHILWDSPPLHQWADFFFERTKDMEKINNNLCVSLCRRDGHELSSAKTSCISQPSIPFSSRRELAALPCHHLRPCLSCALR